MCRRNHPRKRAFALSPLALLVALLSLPVTGCFPTELDVNDKGEILIYREEGFFVFQPKTGGVTPIAGPGGGMPVFARFSPNGKEVLLVIDEMGSQFRFDLLDRDSGNIRTLTSSRDTAYALFSPDGSQVAIVRGSKKQEPHVVERKQQAQFKSTELLLVTINGPSEKVVTEHIGPVFRWFPDGKRLLLFQFWDVDNGRKRGDVVEWDLASGKSRVLASAISPNIMSLDMSADGKKVLFTAYYAGNPGEKPEQEDRFGRTQLFEWQAVDRSVREIPTFARGANYARYSPDGKKVLVAGPNDERGLDNTNQIAVADVSWKQLDVVSTNVTEGTAGSGGGLAVPGWVDDNTIFFFEDRHIYGSVGKNRTLVLANVDGTQKRSVQPVLDRAAYDAIDRFPNQPPGKNPLQPANPPNFSSGAPFTVGNYLMIWVVIAGVGLFLLFILFLILVLRRSTPARHSQRRTYRDDHRYDDPYR